MLNRLAELIKSVHLFCKDLVLNGIAGSTICPMGIRRLLYSCYGHKIDRVYSKCYLGVGRGRLKMGKNSFINVRSFLDLGADIVIGDNVSIGMGTSLINSSHSIGNEDRRAGEVVALPVIIEDGSWIGANVTILPGITIGKGVIVAACSTVTENCSPNCLYAGTPARVIRKLS